MPRNYCPTKTVGISQSGKANNEITDFGSGTVDLYDAKSTQSIARKAKKKSLAGVRPRRKMAAEKEGSIRACMYCSTSSLPLSLG